MFPEVSVPEAFMSRFLPPQVLSIVQSSVIVQCLCVCRATPTPPLAVSVRASYPHRLGDGSSLFWMSVGYVTVLSNRGYVNFSDGRCMLCRNYKKRVKC